MSDQGQVSLKKNIGFSAMGVIGAQAISFIGMLVLARLLSPHEFGLMVMAGVFTALAIIFIDMGMGAALIHQSKPTASHYNTAFWVNMGISLLLMLGVQLISPYAASFFDEGDLASVLVAVSFLMPLSAMSIVPMAMIQKSQNFKQVAWIELASIASGFTVALWMASNGAGVWALVVNLLITSCIKAALSLVVAKWTPTLMWSKSAFAELWSYSSYLFGAGIVNYFITNVDSVLVGKSLGTQVLGSYKYAYQLANMPASLVNSVLSRVFFASYVTYKDDKERIKVLHLKVIQFIALLVFPCMLILAPLSDAFVHVFLGEQWSSMANILAFMCMIFLLDSIGVMSGTLFLSQGKTKELFWLNLVLRSNQLIAMLIGIQYGLEGLLWALLLVRLINFYPVYHVVGKTVGFSAGDVLRKILPILLSSIFVGLELWSLRQVDIFNAPSVVSLLVLACIGFLSYAILMFVFQRHVLFALRFSFLGK